MTFTDDDLRRLKEEFNDHAMRTGQPFLVGQGTLDMLLARLEAAENCLNRWGHHSNCSPNPCNCGYETWRKAAGK
jgi:hypothetical protein